MQENIIRLEGYDNKYLELERRELQSILDELYEGIKIEDFLGEYTYDDTISIERIIQEKYGKPVEVCPCCEEEVQLRRSVICKQACPSCGSEIINCSMCLTMDCTHCKLIE
ncbi:MAG: hypothetical protein ACLTDM_15155 [Clostridium butyricum]